MAPLPIPSADSRATGTDPSGSVVLRPCTWLNVGAGNNWDRICRDHFRTLRSGFYHPSSLFVAVDVWQASRGEFVAKLRRAVGLADHVADASVEDDFRQFAARNLYLQGDLTAPDTYTRLTAVLDKSSAIRVFYLGLPGSLMAPVIGYLQANCCRTGDYILSDKPWWHLRGVGAGQHSTQVA
jgi:hypothetical protein